MAKAYTFEEFMKEFYSQTPKKEKARSHWYELGRKMARESLEEADKQIEKEKLDKKGLILGMSCVKDMYNNYSYSLKDAA